MSALHTTHRAFDEGSYPTHLLLGLLSLTTRVIGLLPAPEPEADSEPEAGPEGEFRAEDDERESPDAFASFLLGIVAVHRSVEEEFQPSCRESAVRGSTPEPPDLRGLLR